MRIANEGAESWLFISAVYVSIHLQSTKPKKDNNNNNVYFTFVRTYLLYIITSYHIYNIIMVNIIISYHLLAYY